MSADHSSVQAGHRSLSACLLSAWQLFLQHPPISANSTMITHIGTPGCSAQLHEDAAAQRMPEAKRADCDPPQMGRLIGAALSLGANRAVCFFRLLRRFRRPDKRG